MVNGYSAMSYGVTTTPPTYGDIASEQFYQAQLAGYHHAGILSTPTFLNRYPTTDTNRNRHRAKIVFDYFLNTDILTWPIALLMLLPLLFTILRQMIHSAMYVTR